MFEFLLTVGLAAGLGLLLGLMGGLPVKYQIALMVGGIFICILVMFPERRLLCILLWILIQPLSIEKVFFANSIYQGFMPQDIVINAGDALLVLLAGIMLIESQFTNNKVWHWPALATLFGLYLLWAFVSAVSHAAFLDTGYTGSSPLALLTYIRTLLFIVIVHSAIRTRAELVCILFTLAWIVLGEACLVALSYVTGEIFNFAKLTGQDTVMKLQTFSGAGEKVVRGVGTLGQVNQQALFHTLYTLPLIALLVVRNTWFRVFALAVMGASAMALLLSFSRSAWLSFALALTVIFVMAWRRREIKPIAWLTGAVLAVVMAIALGVLSGPIYERIAHGDDGATDSRLRMIGLATDLFLQHPILGVGPGEYPQAALLLYPDKFEEVESHPPGAKPIVPPVGRLEVVRLVRPGMETLTVPLPVHNKYLLTLSELGVVGVIMWIAIYVYLFREALACSRARDYLLRYIGVAGVAAVVASMFYMMLDLFADPKTLQVLFFIPVLVTAAARIVKETDGVRDDVGMVK